ncbi:Sh3 and cysteine-rich domain-containing protein 3 [Plakobranchus ocellatus]|uniref:Sh3 and cysteine-rich domain-containing protein 3 n=1 Tax=Plakobranchus ocellatus TaxID=259542 RepID=A0AAV4BJJ3_9GAST|nr:Sh3 and cysteine-rich domain-containing protein 3 [Plakobranchus ocellatus]
MLTPKQNGYVEGDEGQSEEDKSKRTASIKGMWKKAFKSLKSNDKQAWLSKKGSLKKKDEETEDEPQEVSKEIDPVYSLLKCAADLPKVPKAQKDIQCPGHLTSPTAKADNSSGSTSKASSPSSSGGLPNLNLSHHHHHHHSRSSLEGPASPSPSGASPTSPPPGYQRETMHHIVDESLGSEFRTFYKLTSPVKKTWNGHSFKKQHSYSSSASSNSYDNN